jgi:hypothetical protein
MDLTHYISSLQQQLAVAAAAGGEEARALAERLTAPLESAARLVLLEALSAAACEITCELAPGSVDVRLRGRDPEFIITPPPATGASESQPPAPPAVPQKQATAEGDEDTTARITLRVSEALKMQMEEEAGREGLSVNAWLVRAVASALKNKNQGVAREAPVGGEQFTGWVR